MPRPTGQLKELRQYIEDLEVGLAMRLDDLGARLEATERDLAAIGKHLVPERRSDPGATGPSDTDEEGGNGHA